MQCFLVADLHGFIDRYKKLFDTIMKHKPTAVFMAGDLLPASSMYRDSKQKNFFHEYFLPALQKLKSELKELYPTIFVIMGNDDPRIEETYFQQAENAGLIQYVHNKVVTWGEFQIMGLSYIPPSPFLLKDWERYDVSRYVDPGCTHPYEGQYTLTPDEDLRYFTIAQNLEQLGKEADFNRLICLFHAPPYQSMLDRANLDGQMVDYVPLDVHIGSIAIQRFFQKQQPLLGLHGHVHESSQITGSWRDTIGRTQLFSAAWQGSELAIVIFEMNHLDEARRMLV